MKKSNLLLSILLPLLAFIVATIFLIDGYFSVTKHFLDSVQAQDSCSFKGNEAMKKGLPWTQKEISECMQSFKQK